MPGRPNQTIEPFGAVLRRMRERAGLSQQELAERAGLTPHAVSALERGTRTRPYPHTVRSLAGALGASEDERDALIAAVPRRQAAPRAPDAAHPVDASRGHSVPLPASVRPTSLVVPPTPLYGRQDDVTAVAETIRSGAARIVTLTGPGGVGKTRLAAALSEELAADYPDGVVPILLAALADASDVVATIGRALGVVGIDGPDAVGATAAHLGTTRLLLVLDNFEHLLSAAGRGPADSVGPRAHRARLEQVTAARARRARVRRRAAVAASHGRRDARGARHGTGRGAPAGPRPGPGPPTRADPRHRAGPGRAVPPAVRAAAGHRARQRNLRLLTPQMLLDRLDDITATAGERDLPERQRTMRATLDWSYGLLTGEQQGLFRLLGVFRGGATLDAVEEVAAEAGVVPAEDVLGRLGDLVEQSLVVVRADGGGQVRYDLLEPVAQYANSLLMGDEAARVGAAHAAVFLELAERAAIEYEKAEQVTWLARTEADEANLLVAIDRSLDVGDGTTAARITWALWLYWWLRGRVTVGRRRAEQCLAQDLPPRIASRARLTAATMTFAGGDLEVAAAHWAEALRLGRLEDDPEVICKAGAGVGLAALATDDTATAITRFREALASGVEAGEAGVWLMSLTHVWLGTALLLRGEHTDAVDEIARGLELALARGDRLSTYIALYNLSQAAIATGDHARARQLLEEGIALSQETRDMANLAYFLEALAVVESADAQQQRVAVLLGAAASLRATVGANIYAYYRPDETRREAAELGARGSLGDSVYDDTVRDAAVMEVPEMIRFAPHDTV